MKKYFRKCFRRVLNPVMNGKYNNQERKRLVNLNKKILPIIFSITFLIGTFNFFYYPDDIDQIQTAIIFSVLVGVQVAHYIAIKCWPQYFNVWQQISVLSQHLTIMKYILSQQTEDSSQNYESLYSTGYSFGILFYLFLTGTNQFIKLSLLCSIFIVMIVMISISQQMIPITLLVLMFFTCLIASIKIIQEEKRKQRLFLTFKSNQIWQKVIERFLPINILLIEYDQSSQRIVLNSSNLFSQQNLNIYNDDDLQLFLDVASVHISDRNQIDDTSKIFNDNNQDRQEFDRQNIRSSSKRLSRLSENNIANTRDYSFSLSPMKRKSSGPRRRSFIQFKQVNSFQKNQKSSTQLKSHDHKGRLNYIEKKNLKHHLKEFMVQATKDKNLNRKVHELKIEYEYDNDIKLFQLKIMPFFFDQNYAIITIDNLSNEERLKNKDDLLKVSNHLNNHCRQRVVQNTEQIIRNFIQVQNKAKYYFDKNDIENTKSIFSILQASTFQMCQRTINQVKNVQTLTFSKKKVPIISSKFSLIEQIRTILKRFSYELHKNNQKFKLYIDSNPPLFSSKNPKVSQINIDKKSINQIGSLHQHQYKEDESEQTVSINKNISQSHLGFFSQNDVLKSPKNGLRQNYFSSTSPLPSQTKQLNNQNQQSQNNSFDYQFMQQNYSNLHQEGLKSYNNSQNYINDINNLQQNTIQNGQEYQQSQIIQQLFMGMRQEEIINEENEKNEEASIQNSIGQSQKLGVTDSPNFIRQQSLNENKPNQLSPLGLKLFHGGELPQLNFSNNLASQNPSSKKKLETIADLTKHDETQSYVNQSDSIDFQSIDENYKLSFQNQKHPIYSQLNILKQQKLINSLDNYDMVDKFKFQENQPCLQEQNIISSAENKIKNQQIQYEAQNTFNFMHNTTFQQLSNSNANPNQLQNNKKNILNFPSQIQNNILPLLKTNSEQNFNSNYIQPKIQKTQSLQQQNNPSQLMNNSPQNSNYTSLQNSLQFLLQQSPINSFMHNFSYDKILNASEFNNLNTSNQQFISEQVDSSIDTIPYEQKETYDSNLENSLEIRLKQKYTLGNIGKISLPFSSNFRKIQIYPQSKIKEDYDDLALTPLKYNKPQQLLQQDITLQESNQFYSQSRLSSNTVSPYKKQQEKQSAKLKNNVSRNSLQVSSNRSKGINQKETESISSKMSQSLSQSSESSTSNQSNLANSQEDEQFQFTQNEQLSQEGIITLCVSKKSEQFKQKKFKKEKKDKSFKEIRGFKNFKDTSGYSPKNLKSTSSLSYDYQNISQQFGDNNVREDITIHQDVGRINNILYNFIENSIIHGRQNSEIYMKIIENPPTQDIEQESSYITIELMNTSLYDIEETQKKIDSSQEYYFHDKYLIDQITDEKSYFSFGLRSTRRNLRYLGPFDSINYSYDFPKNKIKCSFSIYKNIEILYPAVNIGSPTQSLLSPQISSIFYPTATKQQKQTVSLQQNSEFIGQSGMIGQIGQNSQQVNSELIGQSGQFGENGNTEKSGQLGQYGQNTQQKQFLFHQQNTMDKNYKTTNHFSISPLKKTATLQLGKDGAQSSAKGNPANSLSNIYNGTSQQQFRKRNSLLVSKDLNSSASFQNKLKVNQSQLQQNLNKSQNLDLSINFVQKFRNNSIYNESSSKLLSRESSLHTNNQQTPQLLSANTLNQKDQSQYSIRQKRVFSLSSQNENITQSIHMQSSINGQPKGIQTPFLSKISLFNRPMNEDQIQQSAFVSIDQDIMFKDRTNSLQFNQEDFKKILTNSTSNRFSHLSAHRMSLNNSGASQINNINNNYNLNQNSNTNLNAMNQNNNINLNNNNINTQNLKLNGLTEQNSSLRASISQKINGNQSSPKNKSPLTNKNRSNKAFTFFQ